jgi:uncharacterized protein (TIGR02246 family)
MLGAAMLAAACAPVSEQKERAANSVPTNAAASSSADEAAVSAIPLRMVDAWNKGSGADFAAAFSDNADFVAFEGTHLKGRKEIASFHQPLFDTSLKGTRLEGEVKFVHFPSPQVAVMHAIARVALPGEDGPSPSRDSMQIFVVMKRDGDWHVEGLLNARKLTLERQLFLDDFDSLPVEAQRQVTDLVKSLKERDRTEDKRQ